MHSSLFGYLNSESHLVQMFILWTLWYLKLCINTDHRTEGANFIVVYMYNSVITLTFIHLILFKAHGSVHHNSMLIKIQPDATVCRYLFTAKSLYMFRVSQHPSSGVLKTVTAASGTGHNTGTAACLYRGLIGHVGGK